MVLLDSEGIDAVTSEGSDDHCIFTLTILLASVLIYNSAGVPTRSDLEGLEYPRIKGSNGSLNGHENSLYLVNIYFTVNTSDNSR